MLQYCMNTKEETLVKRVRIGVICGITLMFVLVCVLVVQFSIMSRDNALYTRLTTQRDQMIIQIEETRNRITYVESRQFIEDSALMYFGWGQVGSVIFET